MNHDTSFDILTQESNPVQTVAPTKEENDMLRATEKITALYCRLSVDDDCSFWYKDGYCNAPTNL